MPSITQSSRIKNKTLVRTAVPFTQTNNSHITIVCYTNADVLTLDMKDFIINESSEKLLALFHKGDWKGVLTLLHSGFYDERFLWVRPSERDLRFIADQVGKDGRVVSVGCGSGLLEWLLTEATGVPVTGLEVDRRWWESPYAAPTFLPLRYADEGVDAGQLGDALLFCYFNDAAAFETYLAAFTGTCVVIVGPGAGRGAHCDPEPLTAAMPSGWVMKESREIGTTRDHIAIYRR